MHCIVLHVLHKDNNLRVVSAAFLLVCFLSLIESTCQTRNYITSKALFILDKIKFQNFRFSDFMISSNGQAFVVPWCSGYHYCTTSFNWAWTQVLGRLKRWSQHVGDSGWWGSLTVVPAGNKAKHLLLVNHTTKTIYHHHLLNNVGSKHCLLMKFINFVIFVLVITCLRGKFGINLQSSLFWNFEISRVKWGRFQNFK